jgi:hypothetical protein
MSLIEKAENRRSPTAGEGCPAWCVFDHDHKEEPVTILHESLPTVIEVSRRLDGGVCEWIDVRTTQYRPEEPNEPPWPPAIELSYHRGSRYRITTLTADEARRLAACLSAEAAHADDLAAERPGRAGRPSPGHAAGNAPVPGSACGKRNAEQTTTTGP